jgi:pyruvate dehydrogenase E1 component alpha subunit
MATPTRDLSKDQLLEMYRQMVLIRYFEDQCKALYAQKRLGGVYLHLYNGQEGTGVGAISALEPKDHVITAYRDHGIALAKGADVNRIMAEMFGKRTGVSGGKGGSMHLADRSKNFWGGYAIVGGHLPLAAGIALKSKYNGDGEVVLSFIGDGATNNGYFHEALNLSGVWDLPVIWLIENNLYGMGTAVEQASGESRLHMRAAGYGIKDYERLDGMDALAVYEVVRQAADYARTSGPVLIESMTYRYEGHGVSDRLYQKKAEEMQRFRDRDPLIVMRQHLLDKFPSIDPELQGLYETSKSQVDAAILYAEQSPDPDYNDLINHIYADSTYREI